MRLNLVFRAVRLCLLMGPFASGWLTAQSPASAAPYTLRTGTERVLVDVVVTDHHGNPVHGLQAADFRLLENGKQQDLQTFDEFSAAPAQTAASMPALPRGQYTNAASMPPTPALTVLLIDRLNTPINEQAYLTSELQRYVDHVGPGALTAIYGLTDHLLQLQGFTGDPALLRRELRAVGRSVESPILPDTLGGATGPENVGTLTDSTGPAVSVPASVLLFQSQYRGFQQQLQASYTLDALKELGETLRRIPGRKNLVWMAGRFPDALFPGEGDGQSPFAHLSGLGEKLRDTLSLLSSAQIAVYPVDAGGLRTDLNPARQPQSINNALRAGRPTGDLVGVSNPPDSSGTGLQQADMRQIAADTGGTALLNTNDLAKAVEDAQRLGSAFYTLGYTPPDPTDTLRFRQLTVSLNGKSYRLSYRRGYYTQTASASSGSSSPIQNALRRALLDGGPEPSELVFRVRATPLDPGNQSSLAEGNTPNPKARSFTGPFQTFDISYAIDVHNLALRREADGRFHAEISLILYLYDADGTLVNARSNTLRADYSAAEVHELLRRGLQVSQRFSIPQHGSGDNLRAAVQDRLSLRVGAIEVSAEELRRLPVEPDSPEQTAAPSPAIRAGGGHEP